MNSYGSVHVRVLPKELVMVTRQLANEKVWVYLCACDKFKVKAGLAANTMQNTTSVKEIANTETTGTASYALLGHFYNPVGNRGSEDVLLRGYLLRCCREMRLFRVHVKSR